MERQLFVRQSTGLVREASAVDATIFNAVFSAPVGATLAWGVFFALSVFQGADLVTATIVSFVLGYAVIAWLLKYLSHNTYTPFVIYRVVLGLAVLGLLGAGVLTEW